MLPVRTYFQKKDAVASAEANLARLRADNAKTQAHVEALQTDEEIERIAREQYNLVRPGDETYHVLPSPQDPVEIPDSWPFNRLNQHLGG